MDAGLLSVTALALLIVAAGATIGRFTALRPLPGAALVAIVPAALTVLLTGEFLPDAASVVGMLLVALVVSTGLAALGTTLGRWRRRNQERVA